MKPSKKVEYLRPSIYATLSKEQKDEYNEDVMDLRKKLRALVAYQDKAEDLNGEYKLSINGILKKYACADCRAEVSAKIMRVFFGDNVYFNHIQPIYESKANYENSSKEYRDTHEKVYSPVDYFDIPTLYHYYKFRKAILDKHKANTEGLVKYPYNAFGLDRIISDVNNEYFSKSDQSNMFYRPNDLKLSDEPIKSYVNIGLLQARYEKELENDSELTDDEIFNLKQIDVVDYIKGEVNRYMMSYAISHTSLANQDLVRDALTTRYSKKAIATIKSKSYIKKAEDFLIDHYSYGLTKDEIYHIKPKESQIVKPHSSQIINPLQNSQTTKTEKKEKQISLFEPFGLDENEPK